MSIAGFSQQEEDLDPTEKLSEQQDRFRWLPTQKVINNFFVVFCTQYLKSYVY